MYPARSDCIFETRIERMDNRKSLTERPSWLCRLDIHFRRIIQHDVHEFIETLHSMKRGISKASWETTFSGTGKTVFGVFSFGGRGEKRDVRWSFPRFAYLSGRRAISAPVFSTERVRSSGIDDVDFKRQDRRKRDMTGGYSQFGDAWKWCSDLFIRPTGPVLMVT
jgi:hypothetical protein